MDLNQLLYNHQWAMMNAGRSGSGASRAAQFDLVEYYSKRIARWRFDAGLGSTPWLRAERSTGALGT